VAYKSRGKIANLPEFGPILFGKNAWWQWTNGCQPSFCMPCPSLYANALPFALGMMHGHPVTLFSSAISSHTVVHVLHQSQGVLATCYASKYV
jgi:hypothetical protein